MKTGKSISVVPSYTYILALLRSRSPNEKWWELDLSILMTLIPGLDTPFDVGLTTKNLSYQNSLDVQFSYISCMQIML